MERDSSWSSFVRRLSSTAYVLFSLSPPTLLFINCITVKRFDNRGEDAMYKRIKLAWKGPPVPFVYLRIYLVVWEFNMRGNRCFHASRDDFTHARVQDFSRDTDHETDATRRGNKIFIRVNSSDSFLSKRSRIITNYIDYVQNGRVVTKLTET